MNNNITIPHLWCLVRISDDIVKVMGTWRGGYLDGDRWQLNSGITRVEEDKGGWLFYGHSGSIYGGLKENYGAGPYTESVMVVNDIKPMTQEQAMEWIKEQL